MITKCSECSVKIFMKCLFDGDASDLGGGDFDKIYTEYIDISGIGESKEFSLMSNIHNLNARILFIDAMIEVQKRFFMNFDIPFIDGLKDFRRYGHRITWDSANPDLFIKQLERVETVEKKFLSELDNYMNELESIRKNGVQPNVNGRIEFVRLLNELGKEGYKIDREITDMESVALMVKDYNQSVMDRLSKKHKKE